MKLPQISRRAVMVIGSAVAIVALGYGALYWRGTYIGNERHRLHTQAMQIANDAVALGKAFAQARFGIVLADGTQLMLTGAECTMVWYELDPRSQTGGAGAFNVIAKAPAQAKGSAFIALQLPRDAGGAIGAPTMARAISEADVRGVLASRMSPDAVDAILLAITQAPGGTGVPVRHAGALGGS